VRLRAFGNYAFRIADPKLFHTEISGTRESYTVAELDGQLRGLVLQNISNAIASSGLPFLDLAANQIAFANALAQNLQQGLQGGAAQAAPAAAAPVGVRPDEVMATLEKLADLKAKGILTQEEFDTKKAELLKKLV